MYNGRDKLELTNCYNIPLYYFQHCSFFFYYLNLLFFFLVLKSLQESLKMLKFQCSVDKTHKTSQAEKKHDKCYFSAEEVKTKAGTILSKAH